MTTRAGTLRKELNVMRLIKTERHSDAVYCIEYLPSIFFSEGLHN